eukprot:742940-Rhodomonas_salina.4
MPLMRCLALPCRCQCPEAGRVEQEVLERLDVYESTISCDLGHKRSDFDDDQRARCSSSPRLVQGLSGVTIRKIACGSRHTLAYQTEKDGTHAI